jgi:hypothetical protein
LRSGGIAKTQRDRFQSLERFQRKSVERAFSEKLVSTFSRRAPATAALAIEARATWMQRIKKLRLWRSFFMRCIREEAPPLVISMKAAD